VRRPFAREPDFKANTVTCDLAELIIAAETQR